MQTRAKKIGVKTASKKRSFYAGTKNVYSFHEKNINGEEILLEKFQGEGITRRQCRKASAVLHHSME